MLAWIARQVVELARRTLQQSGTVFLQPGGPIRSAAIACEEEQFQSSGDRRGRLRTGALKPGEGRPRRTRARPLRAHELLHVAARQVGCGRRASEGEERRRDVDLVDGSSDRSTSRRRGGARRQAEDERNPQHLLVEREAVLPATVIEKLLAVVGGEQDGARSRQPASLELVEKIAEGGSF